MSKSQSSARLELAVLGEMRITLDQAPVAGKLYGKVLALLAFLAVESGRRHARESLADMLWPSLAADSARTNLRQALYYLRQALEPCGVRFDGNRTTVALILPPSAYLDLTEFRRAGVCPLCANRPGAPPCAACIDDMARRAALYRGDFLAGLNIDNAAEFEAWREGWRRSLQQEALSLHERLSMFREAAGDTLRAIGHMRHYLALAPWEEAGHRRLMQLLAASGQAGAALAQFKLCEELLQEQLGISPLPATRSLAERIRATAGEVCEMRANVSSAPEAEASPSERRQVTIVCCVFEHQALDPEDVLARIEAPQRRLVELLRQRGAHVSVLPGNVVLAYFGYPVAMEDMARHAVHAGKAALVAAEGAMPLRVAVHTGTIVTGAAQGVTPQMPDPSGAATRIALRLLDLAAAGEVLVDEATRQLVQGYFELSVCATERHESGLKLPVHRVGAETGARSRLEAAAKLTPLTGRQSQLQRLRSAWKAAAAGKFLIRLVRGDPGIGKSRLVRTLREELVAAGFSSIDLYCFPEYANTPYHPLATLLEMQAGIQANQSPRQRRKRLSGLLAPYRASLPEDALQVLESVLVPGEGGTTQDAQLTRLAQERKSRTLPVLQRLIAAIAARQPLLVVVEDVHWLDPSSSELLSRLTAQRLSVPVLLLLTARGSFRPAWLPAASILELMPLSPQEIAALVRSVDASLPAAVVERIAVHSDGVPLFAEELAHRASATDVQTAVPPSLAYLLQAQLDALGSARRIAQLAATIGRDFEPDLLAIVCELDPSRLALALQRLEQARLVTMPDPVTSIRQFRHALIQEAAYQSQTRADRQAAHLRIAEVMATALPQFASRRPEQVARHYTAGGEAGQAIEWWQRAGNAALRRHANAEAVGYLRAGLALSDGLPEPQGDALALRLLLPLGQALLTLHGYGSSEAAEIYDRAHALAQVHGNPRERFEALWGLWVVSSSRAHSSFTVSGQLARQLLRAARASRDTAWLAAAWSACANIALWQGRLGAACCFAERGVAAWDRRREVEQAQPIDGHNPSVASLAHLAWGRYVQGRTGEAEKAIRRALEMAHVLGDPESMCFALFFAAMLRRLQDDPNGTAVHARTCLELAERYRFALWRHASEMLLGWAQAFSGDAQGLQRLDKVLAELPESMPSIRVAFLHARAHACGELGRHAEQLRTIEAAFLAAAEAQEHFFASDLYRLQAEAFEQLGERGAAVAACEEALRRARRRGARELARRVEAILDRL